MIIKELIPCICTPEAKTKDGVSGLPVLTTYIEDGELWFAPCCMKCGRGNRYEGKKTPEEALDAWNDLQTKIRKNMPKTIKSAIRKEYSE